MFLFNFNLIVFKVCDGSRDCCFFSAQLLLARAVKTSMGLSIGSMGCCQLWCLEPSHGTAMASAFRYVVSGGVPISISLQSAVK